MGKKKSDILGAKWVIKLNVPGDQSPLRNQWSNECRLLLQPWASLRALSSRAHDAFPYIEPLPMACQFQWKDSVLERGQELMQYLLHPSFLSFCTLKELVMKALCKYAKYTERKKCFNYTHYILVGCLACDEIWQVVFLVAFFRGKIMQKYLEYTPFAFSAILIFSIFIACFKISN